MITMDDFEKDCDWLNEEYRRCYGKYPDPKIEMGVPFHVVGAVFTEIVRHHVEQLKTAAR
jgi:hypothetical protein